MMNPPDIRCPDCHHAPLEAGEDTWRCPACRKSFEKTGLILQLRKQHSVDLRVPASMCNLHELRNQRLYFGSPILSQVDYAGKVHSVTFSNFHAELLGRVVKNGVIADMGCGQLPYVNSFSPSTVGFYLGFDLDPEPLQAAERFFQHHFPLLLVQHEVSQIPLADQSVDAIISSEVIEHLENPGEHLREAFRICKPGGYLSLSTPCVSQYLYPHTFLDLLRHPSKIARWRQRIGPERDWVRALTWHPGLRPCVLRRWVKEAGFQPVEHHSRLWYFHTPLQVMWRSCRFLERRGFPAPAAFFFQQYLDLTDRLLGLNVPILKWAGIRQFILCRK